MRVEALVAAMVGALALSGCQTRGADATYVKLGPGPTLEVATAECKAYAAKASHLVVGIGGPEALVLGLIATAAATTSKRIHVFEQCMAVKGYRRADAPVAPAPASAPAGSPAKAAPAKASPAKTPPAKAAPARGA